MKLEAQVDNYNMVDLLVKGNTSIITGQKIFTNEFF